MTISNSINPYPFLQASNPYSIYGKPASEGYHQAQGAPTTTPVVVPSYKSEADKYAFMENYNNGNINPTSINPFVASTNPVNSAKGSAWGEGFKVPEYNGTGELSPNYSEFGREDEIIGLDFKC